MDGMKGGRCVNCGVKNPAVVGSRSRGMAPPVTCVSVVMGCRRRRRRRYRRPHRRRYRRLAQ